jgi:hypothetical protein
MKLKIQDINIIEMYLKQYLKEVCSIKIIYSIKKKKYKM